MSRWAIRILLFTLGALLASLSLRAANESLGRTDKAPTAEKEDGKADKDEPDGVITAVTAVKPDPEKDDTIGYITVDGQEIRVATNTRIIDNPADLVHRGMGSLP